VSEAALGAASLGRGANSFEAVQCDVDCAPARVTAHGVLERNGLAVP
jgi:hypothetical protein